MPRNRKRKPPAESVEARIGFVGLQTFIRCGRCDQALVAIANVIEGFGREDATVHTMISPWGFDVVAGQEASEVLLQPTREHQARRREAREMVRQGVSDSLHNRITDARGQLRDGFFARQSDTGRRPYGLKSHGVDVQAWRRISITCPACGALNDATKCAAQQVDDAQRRE